MRKRSMAVMLVAAAPAGAWAAAPLPVVEVRAPAPTPRAVSEFRLKAIAAPANPALQLDAPQSMLRTGYGGSMVDLFPFEGGKFHISGGGRLFGRAGRPRAFTPESLQFLPAFSVGGSRARRFSPAMLVGYGHTVERGLALGIDAGMVMGRIGATPDRLGRLNRRRLESIDGRGRKMPTNEVARVTALYRF